MRFFGTELQLVDSTPMLTKRSAGSTTSDLTNPMEWLIRALAGSVQSATGITVTPLKALGVACVYACTRYLADTISTLPLQVKQIEGRKRRIATEHRLFRVLSGEPNTEMTSADWLKAVVTNFVLQGVGYSEVMRLDGGRASGVYPIEAGRMDFYRDPTTKELRYTLTDVGARKLKPTNVLHFKNFTANGLNTLNTTMAVRECIALALAMQDNAAKFFGNGSRPNGVLKHPGNLSKEAQDRLKQDFEEQASGANLYRLMLLEEGLEYVATRSENKDSQFQEARDAQNLEICRVFGVPPHKVGIQNSQPRANIEEENIGFVIDRVRPICVTFEQEMNRKLFSVLERDQGFCTYFDIDALMRGNRKARFETYAAGRQWGILTTNDCRAEEGLDDVPGGDVLLQPVNMIDASQATKYLMSKGAKATQGEGGNGGKPNANTP